jgi:hypothetical protein
MIMSLLGVVHTTPSGLLYLLKRIYLNLPTLDLALFTTNLLTDNMSHEDYAWWFLALNYFLGPLPQFINKYPKFSTAFDFVLDLTPGQVTFTDGQVAELQKVLNDIITKNLVKFKLASCRQETSIKQQKEIATTGMWLGQSNSLPMTKLSCSCSSRTSTSWAMLSTSSSWIQSSCTSVSSTKFQPKQTKSGHPTDFSCALSPQSSQIFEPGLEKALDCQGCEQMHKPGKCRGAPPRSAELVHAARPSPGFSELDRYALLSRTIENELAGAKLPP